jgi:hypothetical protein
VQKIQLAAESLLVTPLAPVRPILLHSLGHLLPFLGAHGLSSTTPSSAGGCRDATGCSLQFL